MRVAVRPLVKNSACDPVARRDADLQGDARDSEGPDTQVPQRHLQRRASEGGHGELVEHSLIAARRQIRNDLEPGRIAEEPGFDLLRTIYVLPGHRRA